MPQHFPKITFDQYLLRLPTSRDVPSLIRYFKENETHLELSYPKKPAQFYTTHFWKNRVQKTREDYLSDQSVKFCLFDLSNEREILGMVEFTQIIRGAFQACYLGYSISKRREGKGIMFRAVQVAINYIFAELNIHRIMANYSPENRRSAQLLSRLGFVVEGVAKNYLLIHDEWRDHALSSLTNSHWRSEPT